MLLLRCFSYSSHDNARIFPVTVSFTSKVTALVYMIHMSTPDIIPRMPTIEKQTGSASCGAWPQLWPSFDAIKFKLKIKRVSDPAK